MKRKRDSGYLKKITNAYFVILAVALFTLGLAAFVSGNRNSNRKDYADFGNGWETADGESADLDQMKQYGSVYKTIPVVEADQTLSFHVRSMNLQVYVDSKLVYETDSYAEYLFGKTPGSYYVQIPIKDEYAGKTMELKGIFPYDDEAGKITDMYIGRGIDIVMSSMKSAMSGFIVSVLMTFLGMLLALVYLLLRKQELAPKELLYLGFFSMNVGLYLMTNCGFLNILISRENLIHMIEELWMMLIVVPLICYLDCKYSNKNNKPVVIAISLYSMIVFVFCYISHWLNWKDYHELMTLNHIGYGLVISYFTYCVIRKIQSGSTEGKKWYLIGPIFIFVGVLMDIVNWRIGSTTDSSVFTRVGVLVFLILEGVQIVEKILIQYQKGIKAQIVGRLAYHDGLTDLLNRTSFMEEQERMEQEHVCGLIAMFDVNNLKMVNDTYGHTKGDELIVSVADAISTVFGDLGKCFRIGGDEFVLLTEKDCSEEQFLEQKKKLPIYLEEKSHGKDYPISVACGYTIWDDEKHHCFHDFLNEADSRMYENKKRMKAQRKEA